MDKPKIFAMIPARIGSTRLKMKNLALIDGKPLIYYAVKAALDSGIFDRIIINSDHEIFKNIADRYGVAFYNRPKKLGSSITKSDDVVSDFIEKNPCDILAWVNSTSPLQTGREVKDVVQHFLKENLDSLITVKNEQVHCVYKNKPVNFNIREIFAQTQDLVPVQPFVYSVMMWRTHPFMEKYKKDGYALFCGETGFYPVDRESSIIIKRKEDLILAEQILKAKTVNGGFDLEYDELVEEIEER